jgi:hypothetical protein
MKERRKTKRRPILDTFNLSIVIPKKGGHRLAVHDVSEGGMAFDFDMEGEATDDTPLKPGETIDLQLYLNQSLFIPLKLKVARVDTQGMVRRVGAELMEKDNPAQRAFTAFIDMLDQVVEVAQISSPA